MLSIIYFVQVITSAFIYYVHMRKLKTLKILYINYTYLKISIAFLALYIFSFILFSKTNFVVLYPIIMFFSFKYLKLYYKNLVMENDEYLYNGVATIRKTSVKKVFIENGSNLEKKYKIKYLGMEKYKKSDYIIFEFNENSHVLVKNYDDKYLDIIKSKFEIREN